VRVQYRSLGPAVLAALLCLTGLAHPAAAEEELTDHLVLLELLGAEAADELIAELQFPPGSTIHLVPEVPHAGNWLIARLLEQRLLAAGHLVIAPRPALLAAPPSERGSTTAGAGASGGPEATGAGQEQQEQTTDEPDEDEEREPDDEEENGGGDQEASADEDEEAGEPEAAPAGSGPGAANQVTLKTPGTSGGQRAAAAGAAFAVELPAEGQVLTFRVLECGISYPWSKRSWLIGSRRYGRMASIRLRGSRLTQPGQLVDAVSGSDRVHLDSFPAWARPVLEGESFPFPITQPEGTPMRKVLEPVIVAGIVSGLVYLFYENQK
jgi:hypothetical protein